MKNMSGEFKEILGVLNDDPSGFLYVVSLLGLVTFVCGLSGRVWRTTLFRILLLTQLLIFPVITVLGFYFYVGHAMPR
jgi:hypothetical protein